MIEVFVLVGGLAAVGSTTAGAATWLTYRAARRRVRLPNGPNVPVRWGAAPSTGARLHRRLTRVVGVAEAVAPRSHRRLHRRSHRVDDGPIAELAGELRAHAVELDHQIVWANRLAGAPRAAAMRELAASVAQLEHVAHDVVALAAPPSPMPAVHALADRARLLAESTRELNRL